DGVADAAAVLGHVAEAVRLAAVDEHGAAAHLGVPHVGTAAGGVHTFVTYTHRRQTIRQHVSGALNRRTYHRMWASRAAVCVCRVYCNISDSSLRRHV